MEFTKLSEVEVVNTATDTDKILIEQNGEIKRIPKTEVGGVGGYIATLTTADISSPQVSFNGIVLSENYDELYDVLCAGGSAWIDFSAAIPSSVSTYASDGTVSPTNFNKMRASIIFWSITDIGLIGAAFMTGDLTQILFPNGSHNLVASESN